MFRTATKFFVRRYCRYRSQILQSSMVNQRSSKIWSPLPHKSILGISGDILKQGARGVEARTSFLNPKSSTWEKYSQNIKITHSKRNDSTKILFNTSGKIRKFLGNKQNLCREINRALQGPQTWKDAKKTNTGSSGGGSDTKDRCSKSKPCQKGKKKRPKSSDSCKKGKKDSGKGKRHCIPTKMKIDKKLCCPEGVVVCERKATCSNTEVTRTICLQPTHSKSKIAYAELKTKDGKCKRTKKVEPCKVERGDPCIRPSTTIEKPKTKIEPCKVERGDPCVDKNKCK